MVETGQLTSLISQTPTKNLLWKVYDEKTRLRQDMLAERKLIGDDRCFFKRQRGLFDLIKYHENIFVVGPSNERNLLVSIPLFEGANIFEALKITEYRLVNFYSSDKPEIGRT